MRRLAVAVMSAALVGVAAPASAAPMYTWDFCTANTLNVCMNFQLTNTGTNTYRLRVEYVSTTAGSGQEGLMTAAGLWRWNGSPDLDVSGLAIVNQSDAGVTWQVTNGNQLNGGGNSMIEVFGASNNGVNDGFPVGGWVEIGFTSTGLASYDLSQLNARSKIQSFGNTSCSLKPDSYLDDNVVGGADQVNEDCGTSVVPEPITMVLLGSGLLGLGGVGLRRRKHEDEGEDAA